ncbi:hypothetical protein BKH46_01695 [Helicobacter sp. 12S02634-8]|uniref:hypothetical protein n=1 Tax=Helicobacter sp. 12S02634-8 TaxID=1476199 RepID=UPI000BA64B32|nr:hypothetical protein [Helicobacter sp. 12S02634-8]PAF48049.1 hypothetical protein BKH46_01695 [Helicobacter sp. 12S02634-8]
MESALEILKKIGVKEISKATKISAVKIEDILEKRFSNLQRVRVVGFLSIIEREYKVDLSGWLEEYDKETLSQVHPLATPNLASEYPINNLDLDTQGHRDTFAALRKKQSISKKRFYVSVVVVLVLLGVYFIYKSIFVSTQSPSAPSPQEALDNPTQISPSTPPDSQNSQSPQSPQDSKNPQAPEPQAPKAPTTQTEVTQKPQEPQASESIASSLPKESPTHIKNTQNQYNAEEIRVIPHQSLWIEIIDLDDKSKIQTIVDSEYSIEAKDHRLLISFGHGELSLQTDGGIKEYHKSYPMRFLYTPKDGLKQIRYAQYLKLSGQDNEPSPTQEGTQNPPLDNDSNSSQDNDL